MLTFCVVFVSGVLGAITANDLRHVTGDAFSKDLIDKVTSLRSAIIALAVISFFGQCSAADHDA